MPTSANYFYWYPFGSTPIDDVTNYSPVGNNFSTVSDSTDGNADGFTIVGDTVGWSSGTATLYGFHNGSEPIVVFGTFYYALSNDASLSGIINISMSGTYAYCFGEGTKIATPKGETAVQSLSIGDLIRTVEGRDVAVKWVGLQTVNLMFAGHRAQPVRIRAGALGDGLPHSDLTVTADHGMIIDGLVINASALVNGTTIDLVPTSELPDQITYYHIETEAHDIILANGSPTETFIDVSGRMAFDNYQEYLDLYSSERLILEMDKPRISSRRLLTDAIKARVGIKDPVNEFDLPLRA